MLALLLLSPSHVPGYGCDENCCHPKYDIANVDSPEDAISQAYYLKNDGGLELDRVGEHHVSLLVRLALGECATEATPRARKATPAPKRSVAVKPEAAKASGLADEFYLDQWNGDQPAAGTENGPVLYIPHLAARTYCQGRGGLPQISDAPTTWADDGSRIFELRFDGDQAAVIEYSGSVTRVGPSQALMMTGFRCAR